MSHAVDDQNRFHANIYHVGASLTFEFKAGQLVIEVGSDVRKVELAAADTRALIAWLDQNVGGQ